MKRQGVFLALAARRPLEVHYAAGWRRASEAEVLAILMQFPGQGEFPSIRGEESKFRSLGEMLEEFE